MVNRMVEVISAAERVSARRLPGRYLLRKALLRSRKLGAILTTPRYRRSLLKHGVAATTEHRAIKFSRRIRTVVDVGASRGQFALFAMSAGRAPRCTASSRCRRRRTRSPAT